MYAVSLQASPLNTTLLLLLCVVTDSPGRVEARSAATATARQAQLTAAMWCRMDPVGLGCVATEVQGQSRRRQHHTQAAAAAPHLPLVVWPRPKVARRLQATCWLHRRMGLGMTCPSCWGLTQRGMHPGGRHHRLQPQCSAHSAAAAPATSSNWLAQSRRHQQHPPKLTCSSRLPPCRQQRQQRQTRGRVRQSLMQREFMMAA